MKKKNEKFKIKQKKVFRRIPRPSNKLQKAFSSEVNTNLDSSLKKRKKMAKIERMKVDNYLFTSQEQKIIKKAYG